MIKYMVASFVDFSICRQSFSTLLTYCQLLLQNVQELLDNAYPRMINMERDQKYLKTYNSTFLKLFRKYPASVKH